MVNHDNNDNDQEELLEEEELESRRRGRAAGTAPAAANGDDDGDSSNNSDNSKKRKQASSFSQESAAAASTSSSSSWLSTRGRTAGVGGGRGDTTSRRSSPAGSTTSSSTILAADTLLFGGGVGGAASSNATAPGSNVEGEEEVGRRGGFSGVGGDDDDDDDTPAAAKKKSARRSSGSLFGAVMNHVQQHHDGATTSSSNRRDADADAAATAMVTATAATTTPSKNSSRQNTMTMNDSMMSPGGFQLLDFVDAVNDSPFCFQQPKRRRRLGGGTGEEGENAAGPTSPETSNDDDDDAIESPKGEGDSDEDDDEWNEIDSSFPLVDWSLKTQLSIQTGRNNSDDPSPENDNGDGADKKSNASVVNNSTNWKKRTTMLNARIQQRAMTRFLTAPAATPDDTEEDDPAAEWQSALLYWRYPASDERARVLHRRRPQGETLSKNDEYAGNNEEALSLLMATSWSRQQQPQSQSQEARGTDGPPASSSSSSCSAQQLRQWQQAFQSLYLTWVQRVQEWSFSSTDSNSNRIDRNDCYFYACGKGQVVLFSIAEVPAISDEDVDDDAGGSGTMLQPQVVLSSSTSALRGKLRRMGVRLFVYDEDGDRSFQELRDDEEKENQRQVESAAVKKNLEEEATASPAVKAELAALRRAQAFGQTVGADVSISIKSRANSKLAARRIRSSSPTVIRGFDDVAAFYEVFLNSVVMDSADQTQQQVQVLPTLACRKLGPFVHASIETLQVRWHRNCQDVTVDGMIFPDSLRDLVAAAVKLETQQQRQLDRALQADGRSGGDSGDGLSKTAGSSCHMIFRTEGHGGIPRSKADISSRTAHGMIGTHSSKWMNTGDYVSTEGNKGVSCKYGRVLSTVVWDSSRPKTLAYKLNKNAWVGGGAFAAI